MQQPYKEKQERSHLHRPNQRNRKSDRQAKQRLQKSLNRRKSFLKTYLTTRSYRIRLFPPRKSRKAKRRESEILTTPAESTWTQPVVKTPIEHDDQDISKTNAERQLEEERIEKERLNALARLEAEREQFAAATGARRGPIAHQTSLPCCHYKYSLSTFEPN